MALLDGGAGRFTTQTGGFLARAGAIMRELLAPGVLEILLVHTFGNYVVQHRSV